MMGVFGLGPPTWDDCCGQPRKLVTGLGASERLVCGICHSWCYKPTTPEPPGRSRITKPSWYDTIWSPA